MTITDKKYLRVFPDTTQTEEWQTHEDAGFKGNLNDKLFAYLGSLGHTGALSDRLTQFWSGQVPSGGGGIGDMDPIAYWFAEESGALFQDTGETTAATNHGDPVRVFKDLQGSSDLEASSTGTRPLLDIDGSVYSLDFDGVDDYIVSPSYVMSSAQITFLVSLKSPPSYSGFPSPTGYGATVSGSVGAFDFYQGAAGSDRANSKGTASTFVSNTPGVPVDTYAVLTGQSSLTDPFTKLWVDGAGLVSNTNFLGGTTFGPHEFRMGARPALTNFFAGKIQGVAVFDRELDSDERAEALTYMGNLQGRSL